MGSGSILIALIGLLGVVVGAFVTKRAEKDKAIHEIKQRLYSDYLEALYSAKADADAIYFTLRPSQIELDDEVRMAECFTATLGKKALVQVNLRKANSDAFDKALARVHVCYSRNSSTLRHKLLGPALEEIHDILRNDLYPPCVLCDVFQAAYERLRRNATALTGLSTTSTGDGSIRTPHIKAPGTANDDGAG